MGVKKNNGRDRTGRTDMLNNDPNSNAKSRVGRLKSYSHRRDPLHILRRDEESNNRSFAGYQISHHAKEQIKLGMF